MPTDATQAVLDHHLAALLSGDLDAIMADYAEDAVLVSNLGGVLRGVDTLRSVFAAAGDLAGFTKLAEHVDGEVGYVTWAADGIVFGTDTFLVRDGKIVVQTVAMFLG